MNFFMKRSGKTILNMTLNPKVVSVDKSRYVCVCVWSYTYMHICTSV